MMRRSRSGQAGSSQSGIAIVAPAPALRAGDPGAAAAEFTRYDIATEKDLLLSHLVAPAIVATSSNGRKQLLNGLPGQVGDWVTQFIDATKMANIVAQAFPVEGQPALKAHGRPGRGVCPHSGVDKTAVYVRTHHRP